MKLLFDQNISPRIVKRLESSFQGSKQVRHVDLEDASDNDIFEFARAEGFTIVTFDSDFIDLNTLRGFPPKIIWLRTGNLTTASISDLMTNNLLRIVNFLKSDADEILEISSGNLN